MLKIFNDYNIQSIQVATIFIMCVFKLQAEIQLLDSLTPLCVMTSS